MLVIYLLKYVDLFPLHSTYGLAVLNNSFLLGECMNKTHLNGLLNQKDDNVLLSEKA